MKAADKITGANHGQRRTVLPNTRPSWQRIPAPLGAPRPPFAVLLRKVGGRRRWAWGRWRLSHVMSLPFLLPG